MTTKNQTQAGFTLLKPEIEIAKEEVYERRKKIRPAIVAKHGEVRDCDLARIEVAEKELELCQGCQGKCLKSNDRFLKPCIQVENGVVAVATMQCLYGQQRELERQFRSSRIPTRYLGKTLKDYETDALNRAAVEYANNVMALKVGAYLYGEPGTGKTFLASLIAQEFLRQGKTVLFAKVPSLLDDIKATFNGSGKEPEMLDKLRETKLVVLDDFGMEKSTQWTGSTLCKILDMRYDNPEGITIITSNMSPKELAEHLNKASDGANLNGSRIVDRCREICKPILLKGTTRRN